MCFNGACMRNASHNVEISPVIIGSNNIAAAQGMEQSSPQATCSSSSRHVVQDSVHVHHSAVHRLCHSVEHKVCATNMQVAHQCMCLVLLHSTAVHAATCEL
jgi:hypothetical protein